MTTAARSMRKEAVRDAKRGIILDAAVQVFEREGLEGASMRAIGEAAGYTAAAIYFHFPSKEAIYAELISRSLDRLIAAVGSATDGAAEPARRLMDASLGFFDFYAANPRDLDLGFYLFRGGMRPKGISPETDRVLNAKLLDSLRPVGQAVRALGGNQRKADAIVADVFAHAVGLLLLQHTGRLKLFGGRARSLMQEHAGLLVTTLEDGS